MWLQLLSKKYAGQACRRFYFTVSDPISYIGVSTIIASGHYCPGAFLCRNMLNSILDLIFPKYCVGCQKEGSYLCFKCSDSIPQKDLICPECKRLSFGGKTHLQCLTQYGLDGLWSFGAFEEILKTLIQKLKYKWITEQADVLIDQIVRYLEKNYAVFLDEIRQDQGKGWIVVPVPLHWQRQNWRGFNQSALIAKKLAAALALPYIEALKRTKNTASQTHFDAEKRQQNIQNAFSPNIPISQYPNILLIDDVWTTGSTMQECTTVLKKNGAQKVWAITIAR